MVKLHFESTADFEATFKSKNKEVTDSIFKAIENAMINRTKRALVFELTFDNADTMFEVSLLQSQWEDALQSCLDHYHELELADQQIDTWHLLEAAKVW
tara:strand:+ start:1574 stop:1870 length:297 start_codon:yes stop_codon:yes gene_type:complete